MHHAFADHFGSHIFKCHGTKMQTGWQTLSTHQFGQNEHCALAIASGCDNIIIFHDNMHSFSHILSFCLQHYKLPTFFMQNKTQNSSVNSSSVWLFTRKWILQRRFWNLYVPITCNYTVVQSKIASWGNYGIYNSSEWRQVRKFAISAILAILVKRY